MFYHLWRGFMCVLHILPIPCHKYTLYASLILEYREYWTLEPLPKVSIHPAQDRRISSFNLIVSSPILPLPSYRQDLQTSSLIAINANLYRILSSRCGAKTRPFLVNYSILYAHLVQNIRVHYPGHTTWRRAFYVPLPDGNPGNSFLWPP